MADLGLGLNIFGTLGQMFLDEEERKRRFALADEAVGVGQKAQADFGANIVPETSNLVTQTAESIADSRDYIDFEGASSKLDEAGTAIKQTGRDIRSNLEGGLAVLGFDKTANLIDPRDDPNFVTLDPEAQAAAINSYNNKRDAALSTNSLVQATEADIQNMILKPLNEERAGALLGVSGAALAGKRSLMNSVAEMRRNGLPESFIQGEIQRANEEMSIKTSTAITDAHVKMAEKITAAGTSAVNSLASLRSNLATSGASLFAATTSAQAENAKAVALNAQSAIALTGAQADFETAARQSMTDVKLNHIAAMETYISLGTMAAMNGINIKLGVPPMDLQGRMQPTLDYLQSEKDRKEREDAQPSGALGFTSDLLGTGADIGTSFID